MGDRKWAISTSGYGIEAIVDSALDDMEEEIVPYLKSGDYDGAFNEFADLHIRYCRCCPKNGKSYSNSTTSTTKNYKNIGTNLIVAFSIGAGISLIIILVYRSKLKPVKFQKEAKEYIVPGSFNLRRSDDVFLYFNITKGSRFLKITTVMIQEVSILHHQEAHTAVQAEVSKVQQRT